MSQPLTTNRMAIALGLWGAGLYASLQLQHLPWPGEHGVCGPWGCGPPTEALLACHAGWMAFLAGPTWLATQSTSPKVARFLGITGVTLALGGLCGIALHEALVWWPQAGAWSRPYWFQRYLFSVATLVDAPILQVLLCSGWLLRSARSPVLRRLRSRLARSRVPALSEAPRTIPFRIGP
jgi:hypothetical protein